MERENFSLTKFNYKGGKSLLIEYNYHDNFIHAGKTVIDLELRDTPKRLLTALIELKPFVANIHRMIPDIVLLNTFEGKVLDYDYQSQDKYILPKNISKSQFERLAVSDYFDMLLRFQIETIEIDDLWHSCKFKFTENILPFRGKSSVTLPAVCVNYDEYVTAHVKGSKFKYALYPLYQLMLPFLETFEDECFKIVEADLRVKTRSNIQTQMNFDTKAGHQSDNQIGLFN